MFLRFFSISKLNLNVSTVKDTAGQSWANYKGGKPPSLSNQPGVCSFLLKVAWSGIKDNRLFPLLNGTVVGFRQLKVYIPPERNPFRVGAPNVSDLYCRYQHVGIKKASLSQCKPSWTHPELQHMPVEYSLR